MESIKEKEFNYTMHYFNLSITISITSIYLLFKAINIDIIRLPSVQRYINIVFQKLPYLLDSKLMLSIILISLVFLSMQTPAKANLRATVSKGNIWLLVGASTFFIAIYLDYIINNLQLLVGQLICLVVLIVSFIQSGTIFSSLTFVPKKDLFNELNEQFPQNESLVENELSVTYYHQYLYKNKWRIGVVPVIAPDRSVLIAGSQGSGKTFTIFNPAIYQNLAKGFSLFVYDYACPDLSLVTFNGMCEALKNDRGTFGRSADGVPILPEFNHINFDDLKVSNRCNPFDEQYMNTIEDCNTLVKTLMFNLNKSWIGKEDFWAVSAVNLMTCYVWYLRLVEREMNTKLTPDKKVTICTLPHAIELLTRDFSNVLTTISSYPELSAYSNMFVQGLSNQAGSQIAGQIASTQSALAPLSSPNVTWVMTGNDMNLELNNPLEPRIITMGNNTLKEAVYGSAISCYLSVIMKKSYLYRQRKFSLFIDELPTIYVMGLENYIATIRKHKGCVWMGIQDMEQLTKNYGKEASNVIVNTAGTIFSGLVNGSSAERISKLFGKTQQDSFSTSFNKTTSVSYKTDSRELLPASKISSLSQGQLVGKFADRFENPIKQKLFSGFFSVPTIESNHKKLPLRYKLTNEEMDILVQATVLKVREDIDAVEKHSSDGKNDIKKAIKDQAESIRRKYNI